MGLMYAKAQPYSINSSRTTMLSIARTVRPFQGQHIGDDTQCITHQRAHCPYSDMHATSLKM